MRQFWHAIARSEDILPGHAIPVRVMSEDYTLFRGASDAHSSSRSAARIAER